MDFRHLVILICSVLLVITAGIYSYYELYIPWRVGRDFLKMIGTVQEIMYRMRNSSHIDDNPDKTIGEYFDEPNDISDIFRRL